MSVKPLKKINPNLIKTLMEVMEYVEEGKRLEFLENHLAKVEKTMEEAKKLQKSKNIDYETALDEVLAKESEKALQKK